MEFRHLSGKKCAIELAVPLQMLFIQSLESGIIYIDILALHSCLHAFMSLCIYLNFMVFLICFRPCIFLHLWIRW